MCSTVDVKVNFFHGNYRSHIWKQNRSESFWYQSAVVIYLLTSSEVTGATSDSRFHYGPLLYFKVVMIPELKLPYNTSI